MSGLDDAISKAAEANAAEANQQASIIEQRAWVRVELLVLARRFIDSLESAGYEPLVAYQSKLSHRVESEKVGFWPWRRTVSKCALSKTRVAVGQSWPIYGQQWVDSTPDVTYNRDGTRYGWSTYAAVVFLPASGSFQRAVFTRLQRQRGAGDLYGQKPEPSLLELLRQGECTLVESQMAGSPDDCMDCRRALPRWRVDVGMGEATLPTGPPSYVVGGHYGDTRTVYPEEELVQDSQRYDVLLGPAVRLLNAQLQHLGVPWGEARD